MNRPVSSVFALGNLDTPDEALDAHERMSPGFTHVLSNSGSQKSRTKIFAQAAVVNQSAPYKFDSDSYDDVIKNLNHEFCPRPIKDDNPYREVRVNISVQEMRNFVKEFRLPFKQMVSQELLLKRCGICILKSLGAMSRFIRLKLLKKIIQFFICRAMLM